MNKKLILFDLDQTLADSKQPLDDEMSELLKKLLEIKKVGIISGGKYEYFEEFVIKKLDASNELLEKLFLFPTCGAKFHRFQNNQWFEVYSHELSKTEREKIIQSLQNALSEWGYKTPEKTWGEIIEDRGTQVTFSAFGQQAPLDIKEVWDPDGKKRKEITEKLQLLIPQFEIRIGGSTSIDVTKKGIDKGYGVRQIVKELGIKKEEIFFVGDKIYPGGNDYPVKQEGVESLQISGPEETKKVIQKILDEN